MGDIDGGPVAADGAQPERLVAPPLPDNPTQLDHGAYEFAQRCMACHGDQGQGLTEEWRAAWGEEEKNCWQAKCHAASHPPEGFELPKFAPPLIGDNTLGRFGSAQDLYDFIHEQMPWHAPGSLEEESYWQLAAFLLHSNHVPLPAEALGPQNASLVRLREEAAPPAAPLPRARPAVTEAQGLPTWTVGAWMLGMLLTVGMGFLLLTRQGQRKR